MSHNRQDGEALWYVLTALPVQTSTYCMSSLCLPPHKRYTKLSTQDCTFAALASLAAAFFC